MIINGYKIGKVEIEKYSMNGNTAINLYNKCEYGGVEPFATITVNFENTLPSNMAYLDTNNCGWITEIMKKYEWGEPTGTYITSGFCKYPLYKLNLEKIKV